MNKTELVAAAAAKSGQTQKNVELTLDAVMDVITEALHGGEQVKLIGFGSFDVKERPEHIGRNPQTKQEMVIPASKVAKFTPGKMLKDAVAE